MGGTLEESLCGEIYLALSMLPEVVLAKIEECSKQTKHYYKFIYEILVLFCLHRSYILHNISYWQ